ncbi:MAG: hypothetical protein M1823_004209 [Watsoniomyces obsoletus]|nr:MAG: hypothetical protein M1823_004209 [Watsoniomyces obsoletus]
MVPIPDQVGQTVVTDVPIVPGSPVRCSRPIRQQVRKRKRKRENDVTLETLAQDMCELRAEIKEMKKIKQTKETEETKMKEMKEMKEEMKEMKEEMKEMKEEMKEMKKEMKDVANREEKQTITRERSKGFQNFMNRIAAIREFRFVMRQRRIGGTSRTTRSRSI